MAIDNAALDDLLCRWHAWRTYGKIANGYANVSSFADGYRTSRQYDDANGAHDAWVEHLTMRRLDGAINELSTPQADAIRASACALACGTQLQENPRLPKHRPTLDALLSLARANLWSILAGMHIV